MRTQPANTCFLCFYSLAAAAPVLKDDTFPQPGTGPTLVPGPGVKGNDTIPCGSQAVITVVTQPARGSVTLQSGGGFAYTPRSSPNQNDFFEYKVGLPCDCCSNQLIVAGLHVGGN